MRRSDPVDRQPAEMPLDSANLRHAIAERRGLPGFMRQLMVDQAFDYEYHVDQ